MNTRGLVKYSFLSIIGVFVLFIIPFILLQFDFDFDMLSSQGVLGDEAFIIAVKNTLLFMIIYIPIVVILGFILAYLTEYFDFSVVIQMVIILPIVLPALSVSGFFKEIMYDGFHEQLGSIGFLGVVFLWASTGYSYLIMLISLKSRDKSIEQAARIDGANHFQVLFKIILPLHSNALVLSIILSIYNSLRIFKYTFAIFGEIPELSMFTIQNYLYIKLKKFHPDVLVVSADIFLIIILVMLLAVVTWGNYRNKKLVK
ncbi:sugar ABC transporter permease [Sedimentibacter sp. zth1]|uniref:carbohydrate ABC transporter permease n=1 Tax=Sedimentibacter sp. zth1 TaxID=2816908 RepID=UPI001A9235F6|nr:ABC transporter permease subunit [Sedimentibacter sp. zth1]QSX04964.1 sugar ABC transporter permease [Sedimentibacter sp. zth1]